MISNKMNYLRAVHCFSELLSRDGLANNQVTSLILLVSMAVGFKLTIAFEVRDTRAEGLPPYSVILIMERSE